MGLERKRLMVLGAGPFQAPAIRKAAELGCHVITVDYLPGNVGHQYGHHYVNCSTVDNKSVLRAARELEIDGICTFSSDVAVPTVAYVREELGLPGASSVAAETMATKNRFRTFLQHAGLTCPGFLSASRYDDITDDIDDLKPPVVFKPVDTSGSRGITLLVRVDHALGEQAFFKAQGFSRTKTVCVEEFVAGVEVGGDAILIDGSVAFVAITHKHLDGFVVTGHSLPKNIGDHDEERVIREIEAACAALKYRTGPLNFDAIVANDSITILEMSARNGGNGIPAVIERATGVDVERATIILALGMNPDFAFAKPVPQGAGSFVFGSHESGTLKHICEPDMLKKQLPEVFDVYYAKHPCDQIEAFEHNGNFIGYVLFDCKNASEYECLITTISSALDIAVGPA